MVVIISSDNFFPFFLNLQNKRVLVIGGGEIAFRKIKTLMKCGSEITLITKEIKSQNLLKLHNIKTLYHEFKVEDVDDIKLENEFEKYEINRYFMVIAASNSKILNDKIASFCMRKDILVNNITSKEGMNFRFCSIYENDNVKIGISGKGDPKIAKDTKEKLKSVLE